MRFLFYFLLLFAASILETTVMKAPLTLAVLIALYIIEQSEWVFFVGIVAGIVLDSLFFRLLGLSSLFFLVTMGVLFLYGRKFETRNALFGFIVTLLAAFLYEIVFQSFTIFGIFVAAIVAGILIFLFHHLTYTRLTHESRATFF